uniref:Uncharacterized protein n=1 Tax=Tetranychus urticae TaxID=32264 RepID=T1L216_TETUR
MLNMALKALAFSAILWMNLVIFKSIDKI